MSLNHHLTKINSPRRNKNLTSLTEGLKISSRLLSAVKELLRLSWPGIFRFATMLYIRSNFKKIKEKKDTTSKKKREIKKGYNFRKKKEKMSIRGLYFSIFLTLRRKVKSSVEKENTWEGFGLLYFYCEFFVLSSKLDVLRSIKRLVLWRESVLFFLIVFDVLWLVIPVVYQFYVNITTKCFCIGGVWNSFSFILQTLFII